MTETTGRYSPPIAPSHYRPAPGHDGKKIDPSAWRKRTSGSEPRPWLTNRSPGADVHFPLEGLTPYELPSPVSMKLAFTFPAASKTRTCGPPPSPAPVTIQSVLLSGDRTHPTYTPPVKPGSYAMKPPMREPLDEWISTSGPPPGPGAVTISAWPSPLTSHTATRTPPVKLGA